MIVKIIQDGNESLFECVRVKVINNTTGYIDRFAQYEDVDCCIHFFTKCNGPKDVIADNIDHYRVLELHDSNKAVSSFDSLFIDTLEVKCFIMNDKGQTIDSVY